MAQTPFVGSMPAAQHPAAPHPQPEMLMAYSQETVRLHAGVNHGRPPTHSPRHAHRQPAPPSTFHPTQWPTLYRPPTYGRSVDGVVSYPPTESTESEHAYATVHSPSYENQMVASVRSGVANSRRFAVLKHMDMVWTGKFLNSRLQRHQLQCFPLFLFVSVNAEWFFYFVNNK